MSTRQKIKAFCSWSGGKESAMSCYKAMQNHGIKITYLLNMVSEGAKFSRTHGISAGLLKTQAEAIKIPLVQRETAWKSYEEEFKKAISDFKKETVQTGVFGDIDLQEHRDWVERVCREAGIKPILPLWQEKREKLLEEFIGAGFKAIVCATNAKFLGKEWLGREINKKFIEDVKALRDVDLCGEGGEYHTFVYDGPLFKKPVKFITGKKERRDRHWFLQLTPW